MASLFLAFHGDSQMIGTGTSGWAGPAPNQLALLYPPSRMISVVNIGAVGYTIASLTAEVAAKIDVLYDSRKGVNVLVVWIGTNDLYNGGTPATIYSNLVTYCQARKAVGFKVVVVTMLPRSDAGIPGSFAADRLTFNANVRANYLTFADALADVAADSRIGDTGDELDLTYYQSDKIHPNATGHGVVATVLKTAVDRIA